MNEDEKPVKTSVLGVLLILSLIVMVAVWVAGAFEQPSVTQSPSPSPSVTAVTR